MSKCLLKFTVQGLDERGNLGDTICTLAIIIIVILMSVFLEHLSNTKIQNTCITDTQNNRCRNNHAQTFK